MAKILRLIGTALLVLVALRVLSWLLAPALPLLVMIFIIMFVLYIAVNGRRGL